MLLSSRAQIKQTVRINLTVLIFHNIGLIELHGLLGYMPKKNI